MISPRKERDKGRGTIEVSPAMKNVMTRGKGVGGGVVKGKVGQIYDDRR